METHNGAGWDTQAEMAYNGLGQRLSMDAAGVIAYYVMDGNRPLTAESDGNTTSYLYGLGVIAEETSEWNYALPDGGNTPRQLTDMQGDVTLSIRYTPWGGALETHGTGNFSFGYLGGILDAATNLIYVGNGQYYDPSTGRFLTRNVNPNSPNPYVPFDPTGLLLGPLGLLAVFYSGRRNKKSAPYVVLLIVLVVLPMSVSLACSLPFTSTSEQVEQPLATQTVTPTPTPTPSSTPTLPPPTETPTPTCTPTPTPTLELYGIEFGGTSWTSDEQTEILSAVQKVGEEFSRILGTGQTSWDAFKEVYGDGFLFHRGGRSGGSLCNGGTAQTVKCFGGAPMSVQSPARLLVHELGHTLVQTRYSGVYTPYSQARDWHKVHDRSATVGGPLWITGTHPTWDACQNNFDSNSELGRECAATEIGKFGIYERTSLGYTGKGVPAQYHGDTPDWTDFSTNPNEDFADMFMNWVYHSFDYSPEVYNAGWYRYYFMEDNMRTWITGGSITTRP